MRAKGKWHYLLLITGFWVISMTVLTPLIGYLLFAQPVTILRFVIGFPIWVLTGIFFGQYMWSANERAYNRRQSKRPD